MWPATDDVHDDDHDDRQIDTAYDYYNEIVCVDQEMVHPVLSARYQ